MPDTHVYQECTHCQSALAFLCFCTSVSRFLAAGSGCLFMRRSREERRGGGVVDNTLDYQSRDRKIDPPLHRSFGRDFKPRSRLRMTSLLVGR